MHMHVRRKGTVSHPQWYPTLHQQAPVAQGIEQAPSKRLAAGSNPAEGATQRDSLPVTHLLPWKRARSYPAEVVSLDGV